jgi:hypothetical protein
MLSYSRGSDIGCGKRQTHETLMFAVLDETQFWLDGTLGSRGVLYESLLLNVMQYAV